MFLADCWYVAGWSDDFGAGELRSLTIAGEPLVLDRRSDGVIVAMLDQCAHRLAPLSLGRLEGDTLRCIYHGVRYGSDGRCVEVPEQTGMPAALSVRTFPTIERHRWAWVWTGSPAGADPNLIPDVGLLDDADSVNRL